MAVPKKEVKRSSRTAKSRRKSTRRKAATRKTSTKGSKKRSSSKKATAKRARKPARKRASSKKSTTASKRKAPSKTRKRSSARENAAGLHGDIVHKRHIIARTPRYIIEEVPEEYVFVSVNGRRVTNLRELANVLAEMSHEDFHFHSNETKNDFANWIHDIMEEVQLARKMWHTDKHEAEQVVRTHLKRLGVN